MFSRRICVLLYSTEVFGGATPSRIALIVASVLGTISMSWLGPRYCRVAHGCLVVGFSADYTIHLGHMFVAAGRNTTYKTASTVLICDPQNGQYSRRRRCDDTGRRPLHAPLQLVSWPSLVFC